LRYIGSERCDIVGELEEGIARSVEDLEVFWGERRYIHDYPRNLTRFLRRCSELFGLLLLLLFRPQMGPNDDELGRLRGRIFSVFGAYRLPSPSPS